MTKEQMETIQAVLANDETSTDQELLAYFMSEIGVSETEAKEMLAKRDAALRGE